MAHMVLRHRAMAEARHSHKKEAAGGHPAASSFLIIPGALEFGGEANLEVPAQHVIGADTRGAKRRLGVEHVAHDKARTHAGKTEAVTLDQVVKVVGHCDVVQKLSLHRQRRTRFNCEVIIEFRGSRPINDPTKRNWRTTILNVQFPLELCIAQLALVAD